VFDFLVVITSLVAIVSPVQHVSRVCVTLGMW
jgi:hypothetical protein